MFNFASSAALWALQMHLNENYANLHNVKIKQGWPTYCMLNISCKTGLFYALGVVLMSELSVHILTFSIGKLVAILTMTHIQYACNHFRFLRVDMEIFLKV